jgi:hypothetical protein
MPPKTCTVGGQQARRCALLSIRMANSTLRSGIGRVVKGGRCGKEISTEAQAPR